MDYGGPTLLFYFPPLDLIPAGQLSSRPESSSHTSPFTPVRVLHKKD